MSQNQDKFRVTIERDLRRNQDENGDNTELGKRYILPALFVGALRNHQKPYLENMTNLEDVADIDSDSSDELVSIISLFGKPVLFITFTGNPVWK